MSEAYGLVDISDKKGQITRSLSIKNILSQEQCLLKKRCVLQPEANENVSRLELYGHIVLSTRSGVLQNSECFEV